MTTASDPRPQLDLLPAVEIVRLLLDAEQRVVPAVRVCAEQIAVAADLLAERYPSGRMVFAGAGTSGRIAAAQAAEMPGTFGLPARRIVAMVAGGDGSTDADEDDLAATAAHVAAVGIDAADTLIAVAASGSTPSTLAVADATRSVGGGVIAVTATPGSPLSIRADVAIDVDVGLEVLRGSSRLTAGTAQKIALDALTTAAMARLGRVHDDHMIDVVPANTKLRARAAGIVAEITGVSVAGAAAALTDCENDARAAVLLLVSDLSPTQARTRASSHRTLRDALADTTSRIRPDH